MCATCYLTFGCDTQIVMPSYTPMPCGTPFLASQRPITIFVSGTPPHVTVVFHYVLVKTLVAKIFTSRNPIICCLFVSYRHFVHDIPPFWLYVYYIYIYHQISIHHNQIVYTNNINCFCEIPIYLSA